MTDAPPSSSTTTERHSPTQVELQEAKLQGVNLQEADLQGANLEGADLQRANLQGANLEGAKLQRTNLEGAELQETNLQRTNLEGAKLQGANLQRTNLEEAKLQGANLQRTNLEGVNLQGANLAGAKLQGANIEEAELQEATRNVEEKYLRLAAEFENYRKRQKREQQAFLQTANAGLIESILPVLDDMERATASAAAPQATLEQVREGLTFVLQKLRQKLHEHGVKEIAVSKGDSFDAEMHEAVAQAAAPSPELRGKVLAVIEKGYRLGERILRYAKVQTAAHE